MYDLPWFLKKIVDPVVPEEYVCGCTEFRSESRSSSFDFISSVEGAAAEGGVVKASVKEVDVSLIFFFGVVDNCEDAISLVLFKDAVFERIGVDKSSER